MLGEINKIKELLVEEENGLGLIIIGWRNEFFLFEVFGLVLWELIVNLVC